MRPRGLPWSIQENPMLDQWVDFGTPAVARVFSAKVELGQGITTAIAQIAAEELRLPMAQVAVVSGDTRYCPNEHYTAGSMSIEVGGTAVKLACAQARRAIVDEAARILAVDVARVSAEGGFILVDGARSALDYWKVAPHVDWKRPVVETAETEEGKSARYVGKSVPRLDLPAKLVGAAFVHDLVMPGMLHGRVLRPPSLGARLIALDTSSVERLPGVVKIWRNGSFVGVCCEREYQAVKALAALREAARWEEAEPFAGAQNWRDTLPKLRTADSTNEVGESPAATSDLRRLSATYSRPPTAHASLGPSCAVASFDQGRLTVWSHSQGVFPLRAAIAAVMGLAPADVAVIHSQGAGAYGHNGADDVALDAALLARQVAPRPVRVQWMRDDEFAWEPFGSPMVVKLEGALTPAGRLADWSTEIWSGPHASRPGIGGGFLLAAAALESPPFPAPDPSRVAAGFFGSSRNSEPPYDLPHRRLVQHDVAGLPMRLSALRSLGGFANVFASESFIDELADAAGIDPIEFRLRNLSDPRARRVIETAARLAGWRSDAPRGHGRGAGLGFSRYKNTAAYVAVVAEVQVEETVRVPKIWCAVDPGLAINPDGVINQIEGGIMQAVSWTLKEQVGFDGRRVTSRSWEEYPILRFDELPEVTVQLIASPDSRPLGVGEASQGPTGAAIANAVARALDFRIRDLPLTRDRIIATGAR